MHNRVCSCTTSGLKSGLLLAGGGGGGGECDAISGTNSLMFLKVLDKSH